MNSDTCGCCKGITALTPVSLENLPGLSALAYRVGTQGIFKTTMRAALSGEKALDGLTSRDDDDPSIALIDAWACVLDVLTFYQERIANEGYLLTASERSSVLELARAIGYELKPGVAAGTFLAFTLDDAPGTPGYATIDTGVKVMSIPGQNEKPQTFETVEKIEAKAVWNALKPRLTEPKIPGFGDTGIYLKGTATGLKPGDGLLFIGKERKHDPGSERWDFRLVKTAVADMAAGNTKVTWEKGLGWKRSRRKVLPAKEDFKVYAFRLRASLFGHNAPDWLAMPDSIKRAYLNLSSNDPIPSTANKWPDFSISSIDTIYLDALYPQIMKRSWVVLSIPTHDEVYEVTKVEETARTGYTLTAKTTRLELSGENLESNFNKMLRETGVFAQSQQLDIAEAPRTDLLSGNVIELDGMVPGLVKGKFLIISGKRMRALVTQAGLELVSLDDEKRKPMRAGDVLWALEPPVQSRKNNMNWKLLDRSGFTGTVTASYDSISQLPAEKDDMTVSEAAELDGVFEKPTPEKLKVVEFGFHNDVAAAAKAGLKGTGKGEAFENGYYSVAGWNGESYAALKGKANKLARIIIEQGANEEMTVNKGDVWNIGGGWKLTVAGINANLAKVLVLTKDDVRKNEKWISKGNVYTYESSIDGETDVPLFVTYVDDITAGSVLFKYTWALDTNVLDVKIGDKISDKVDSGRGTILVLKEPMANSYDPASVTIYANVARATHGETVHEVLGSGNGALSNQSFTPKKPPLTYVSAPTPSGTQSTIEVRVNDVKWQEVDSLYRLDERARSYITRIDDDGRSTIIFGDGQNGARLPTGQENIAVVYRTGIGMQGMVKAGQLSLLMTRPLGVKGVTNPLVPTGAADSESRDQARQNAPQKVLTLERIVSLQDFEDFTRAFAGIGKAQAAWLRDGEVRFVHITVASADAKSVVKTSDLYKNLWLGIDNSKDPVQQFRIDSFTPLTFNLSAGVLVAETYIKEKVLAAVTDALKQAFSFEQRSFGQSVTESEVVAVMQGVEGVRAVSLNGLYVKGNLPALNPYLKADRASMDNGTPSPAELLTLNPDGIELTEMKT